MVRLYLSFSNVVLVILAHVAVFSGLASARSASSATSPRPVSNATGSVVALERRSTVKMNVKWLSNMDTWWLFTRKYNHDITLTVDHHYTGNMKYKARNFNSHCHEDGVWCVTHGDPLSQEMAIWYKGYNFQHPTMTIGCYVEGIFIETIASYMDQKEPLLNIFISYTMLHFFHLYMVIKLAHVALTSALTSAHSVSNATFASPISNLGHRRRMEKR
ncbi:hypothetical protein BG015_010873 [Linnemannia schmuckeri]|uniref:Uncharacterized protein n=1 Tax=Linnemannia schmuckeri TaxID=64567 RepID=A0A9P5V8Y3_9FUNG|nr:hypothetical protein BG015_010873 [Linnemannia schmuckeri]